MRTSRLIGSSLRAMRRSKLRTFFMMLGTLIGVTALTVVMALGRGTQAALMRDIERMFSGSTIILNAGSGMRPGGPHGSGPTTTLLPEDIAAIETEVPAVLMADRLQGIGAADVVFEGNVSDIRILGHSEHGPEVWNRGAGRGAYFTAADVATAARVAVIGTTAARNLFGDTDPIGRQIRIGTVPLDVIGVLEPFGVDPHGIDKDNEVIIPVTTMMRRVLNIDYVLGAKIGFTPGTDLDDAVLRIQDALRPRHAIGPDDQDDFHTFTPVQVEEAVAGANRVFTLFLPLVAGISILVGGLVVANLMLVTVSERRGEIGLRKALGARERDVQFQFLVESAAVTGLGGALAVAGASLALLALSHIQDVPPVVPWDAALLGIGSATLVGLVAGVAPARRAAALDPARTLR